MKTSFLEEMGLTQTEAKVYLALLELKKGKITAISNRAEVYPKNCYDSLERLIDKGLVTYILDNDVKVFLPESPENLKDIIVEKQRLLDKNLPTLLGKFREKEEEETIKIYHGFEGAKKYLTYLE